MSSSLKIASEFFTKVGAILIEAHWDSALKKVVDGGASVIGTVEVVIKTHTFKLHVGVIC